MKWTIARCSYIFQDKLNRGGQHAPSHTAVYGLDHSQQVVLHEHRADPLASHPSTLKRIEDQSHLILDTPPVNVKKSSAASLSLLESSVRKASNLQVKEALPPLSKTASLLPRPADTAASLRWRRHCPNSTTTRQSPDFQRRQRYSSAAARYRNGVSLCISVGRRPHQQVVTRAQ
jgi:hypothetical protein